MSIPSNPRPFLLALFLGLSATSAVAADPIDPRASLRVGPLIGGQDLVVDFRSTQPGALGAFAFSFSKTPIVGGGPFDPMFGLDIFSARVFLRVLDSQGRDFVSIPTTPGSFGPVGLGIVVHFQYVIAPASGPLITSNTVSVEGEPLPISPGFLLDDAAARLPLGFDSLNAGPVHAGDLNRDGFPDLVLATESDIRIWINDGLGGFFDDTSARISYPSGVPTGALAVLDVNGDNHVDIVTGGGFDDSVQFSQPDRLWLNDGSGQFLESSTGFPFPSGFTQQFEFGDFNGDGNLDVIVASSEEAHVSSITGHSRLYFSNAAFFPTWTENTAFAAAAWNIPEIGATGFVAGDVDGDGDLDLVAALSDVPGSDGTPGQRNVLLINDGTGTFTNASASLLLPNPNDNTQGVTLADLDLDGDLDLVFANSHASISAAVSGDLYINQGGAQGGIEGVFVEDASSDLEISTPADWVRLRVIAEDADADGDLDVLMTVHDLFLGADQLLFLNTGGRQGGVAGTLVRQTWFDPGDFISFGAAFLDIDLDGDLDLLQTAQGVVSGDPLLGDDVRLFVNGAL